MPTGQGQPLIDAAGTLHHPAEREPRIVSLVPSITELLFDLGLGDRLVGRTHYCIHPAAAAAVPSLGGTEKIRLDRLRACAPTHAIVNIDENPRELAEAIAALGVTVIVTHPNDPLDNLALYRLIGGIFRRDAPAAGLAARFRSAHDALVGAAGGWPARRVLYLIWNDPWITVSRDTYISRLLALVNWQTVAHDPAVRYPAIELAAALREGADLALFSSEPYRFTPGHIEAFRREHGAGGTVPLMVDGEMLSWYGSRAIRGLGYLHDLAAGLR